jgi:cystathionine beta-lyase
VDPSGRDEITRISLGEDPVELAVGELRRDAEGYLKRAGLELERPLDRAELARALERAEEEMRNPAADLDALDVEDLRARQGEKWALYPPEVIPAWVADMDYPVAEPIQRVLRRAVAISDVGYAVDPDKTGLREVFVERMESRYGWKVPVEQVELLTDVVQGIYVALQVYSEPGDGVIIQTPIYPPFLHAVADTRRRLLENPLVQGRGRYELDLDGLRRAAAEAKVLLLCNPHNPTGRVFTRDELESIAEIALSSDLIVVSDEIHQDLVYPGRRHIPFATLGPEVAARTLTLTSATKAFSIAGLRCALAAFGSDDLKRRFQSIPRHVLGGMGALGVRATIAAWRHSGPWLKRVLAHLERNRDHLAAFIRDRWPAIRFFPPEATYLVWLDCRALELDEEPARFFLKKARVALSQGKLFGAPGEGFVRLNFATSRPILDEVLGRMAEGLAREGRSG